MPRYVAAALALCLIVPSIPLAQPGLTAAPQLASVYSLIFDGDFEQVPGLIARTCPSFGRAQDTPPAEACLLLAAVSTWWQIQIDPNDDAYDGIFRTQVDAAVAALEAWTRREPERAEAWFYLGGALGARAQWRVLRGERLAAAREGKRIKDALERSIAIDPTMQDAWFGIGLYHYYADIAPAAAKMLRWLFLLPGGDRRGGLQEMLRARAGGQLVRDEADYQLHLIDIWYEKQPLRALDLLRGLRQRHPRNPHFLLLAAEVQDYRLRDFTASLLLYRELLELALARRVTSPAMAETHARLGIARLSLPQEALTQLRHVIEEQPASPVGAVAQAQLQLGQVLDRLGETTSAIAAYRAAIAQSPEGDPLKTAESARRALRARR